MVWGCLVWVRAMTDSEMKTSFGRLSHTHTLLVAGGCHTSERKYHHQHDPQHHCATLTLLIYLHQPQHPMPLAASTCMPAFELGTRKPDTKPQPDMKQHILLNPRHGRERRETCGVLPFSKQ